MKLTYHYAVCDYIYNDKGGYTMMKKILIYSNDKEESQSIARTLKKKVQESTLVLCPYNEKPDVIITVGGDGTLLSAFHEYQSYLKTTKFLGIHTGHLGFYTDWRSYELDDIIFGLEKSDRTSVSYPLLDIKIEFDDRSTHHFLALNEIALRSNTGTMVCDVYVKDYLFETFRGDGLCIATPTGSTGLSKSLGGAVIHPRLDAIQLTEMASINNRVFRSLSSPMIIPSDEWFELKPVGNETLAIGIDNLATKHSQVRRVKAKIAKERISFVSFRHMHFWNRVEGAFIG